MSPNRVSDVGSPVFFSLKMAGSRYDSTTNIKRSNIHQDSPACLPVLLGEGYVRHGYLGHTRGHRFTFGFRHQNGDVRDVTIYFGKTANRESWEIRFWVCQMVYNTSLGNSNLFVYSKIRRRSLTRLSMDLWMFRLWSGIRNCILATLTSVACTIVTQFQFTGS